MSKESQTPLTDAESKRVYDDEKQYEESYDVAIAAWAFARDLELKLAEAEREIATLDQCVQDWNKSYHEEKARLDFLISYGAYLSHSRDGEVCNVWYRWDDKGQDGGPAEGYPQKCYHDAREAIDAARALTAKEAK